MNESLSKYYHLTGADRSYVFRHDRMTPDEEYPVHTHSEWELAYVVRGGGQLLLGGESHAFSRGDVVFIPPGMLHGWTFDDSDRDDGNRVEDICLFFRRELPGGLAALLPEIGRSELLRTMPRMAFRLRGHTLVEVRRLLTAMTAMDEEERFGAAMRVIRLLALSDELNPAGRSVPICKADDRIQRIEAHIRLHYNRSISVAEAASLVHMNRSSFCVFFRRMKGVPFSVYLNDYRIGTACHLLTTTDRPVSEIAYCVGFNNPAHFCRMFRRFRGVSPTGYREGERSA